MECSGVMCSDRCKHITEHIQYVVMMHVVICTVSICSVIQAVMSVSEDTYINMIPYNLTDALKGDLDPGDQWKKLFMAVENSREGGPPLDPGFMGQLELCNQRRESPTAKLLSDLGLKGYRVRHLRVWLRAQGLMRSAELLEGAVQHSISSVLLVFSASLSLFALCMPSPLLFSASCNLLS